MTDLSCPHNRRRWGRGGPDHAGDRLRQSAGL